MFQLYNERVINTLLTRASVKVVGEPGPSDADLRLIFAAAMRAPDHGKLRPWRFFVIRGEARQQLSYLFVAAVKRREPGASEAQVAKERDKPLHAPMMIALVTKTVTGHKVPPIEQALSTGAAAMNILNAIHELGFGARWVTGDNCYDPEFKRDFGLAGTDQLLGFIHVGTPLENKQVMERPDPEQFVVEWGV